jgi:hypothetical protein
MWRWALVALMWIGLAAPARAATPVVVGRGPGGLLALAAAGGTSYAVIGRRDPDSPLALVHGGATTPFGGPGAENPVVAGGPGGVVVAWSREVSSELEYSAAPAGDPADARVLGTGTAPPRLAVGDGPQLACPDRNGDVTLGGVRLTADAPEHRHLPLAVAGTLVLDLDQRRAATQLRVLGADAPGLPVVSLASREDLEATLAVDDGHAYVAFVRGGRAFLASAELRPGARWSTRLLAADVVGTPAVARAEGRTYVAFARRGDVYLSRGGGGAERLGGGGRPLIAADASRVLVGWSRADTALLVRVG